MNCRMLRPSAIRTAAKPCCRKPVARRIVKIAAAAEYDITLKVRPYTTRKGDTIKTIAEKRGLTVDQLLGFNPDIAPDATLEVGQTLLIPGSKLSARDREILDGIGPTYRIYPVRAGEVLDEILSKRKISMEEFREMNPGVDVNKLQDGQLLRLPSGKFTVREREMLVGTGILPPEFFEVAKNPFAVGGAVVMMVVGFVFAWMLLYKDPFDEEPEPKKTTP